MSVRYESGRETGPLAEDPSPRYPDELETDAATERPSGPAPKWEGPVPEDPSPRYPADN